MESNINIFKQAPYALRPIWIWGAIGATVVIFLAVITVKMHVLPSPHTDLPVFTLNGTASASTSDPNACAVQSLVQSVPQGAKIESPDATRYLINKEDGSGINQVYLGTTGSAALTCITCGQVLGGPKPERHKMQPHWHPSGKWIFLAVERDSYVTPWFVGGNRDYVEAQLQNGLWINMWVVTPEGDRWLQLTDFKSNTSGVADGYTGPAISPDGKKLVWSQIMDGNIFAYWPPANGILWSQTLSKQTVCPCWQTSPISRRQACTGMSRVTLRLTTKPSFFRAQRMLKRRAREWINIH